MKNILSSLANFLKENWLSIVILSIPVFILITTSYSVIESKSSLIIESMRANKEFFFFAPVLLAVLASFVGAMVSYLNKGIGDNKIHKTSNVFFKEISRLHQKISALENRSSTGASVEITESERAELISDAKKRIIGNTILLADSNLKADISSFNKSYSLHKLHTDMVLRLQLEIDRLNRRGGVNLAIGSAIALIGILSLAYFLYSSPSTTGGLDFFIHHLPKLSFVIVVELFAYFFLRLYKNGFDEIKYFQNEITNIEMKVMSLKYAQDFKSEDMIKELVIHLMKTERNFILEKGQSTVSIEKDKLKNISDSKLTSMISEIIKLKQK